MIELVRRLRNGFAQKLKQIILSRDGAISTDAVSLKVQGRHFYGFTLHCFDVVKRSCVIEPPQFKIKAENILFIEGPDNSTADDLRAYLKDQLQLPYGVDFHSIQNIHSCNMWKFGHLYLSWSAKPVPFFRTELVELHRHFKHPSADKLYAVIKRAREDQADSSTLDQLCEISKACSTC